MMKKSLSIMGIALFVTTITAFASVAGNYSNGYYMGHYQYPHWNNKLVGKQLVLNAKGRAAAYLCDIPATDAGTTQALCFDVPLFNMKTGAYVGILTDALADIVPVDGGGLTVVATSMFKFTEWRKQPTLTTRVLGNIQPVIDGIETMTHITGYIPGPGENNVLSGTKYFRHASGSARESGAVNLASFTGQPGDEVDIDFIWVITLD